MRGINNRIETDMDIPQAKTKKDIKMRRKNILLVDNDMSYLFLLSNILEFKGIEVTKATNGIEAVEMLEKRNFGMMITDFDMPGMNGIELAMKVRELYPDIHIVMITGELSPDVVEAAANSGISQVLSKPVNVMRVLAVIRSILRMR